MRKAGEIVHDIHKCDTLQEALDKYTDESQTLGFSINWIKSVFKNKRSLPVLDTIFDVHGTGVSVLDMMGVHKEVQTLYVG